MVTEEGQVDLAKHPNLALSGHLLIPVLVSSDFLQIEQLMEDSLRFWKDNFSSVEMNQKLPISQLDSKLIQRLANTISCAQLIEFGITVN